MRRIQTSPFIPYKDDVRGFVYEVETGRLREVKLIEGRDSHRDAGVSWRTGNAPD